MHYNKQANRPFVMSLASLPFPVLGGDVPKYFLLEIQQSVLLVLYSSINICSNTKQYNVKE